MPETKGKFTSRIFDEKSPETAAYTKERQHTAQAFNLHVERRDGRHSEGFPWSLFAGYRWTDEGEMERLVVMFGPRVLEIIGHNLGVLVNEVREGQLNSIKELTTRQTTLLEHGNPDNQPIIASVKSYPDFEQILKDIKGEEDDKPEHVRCVAGR